MSVLTLREVDRFPKGYILRYLLKNGRSTLGVTLRCAVGFKPSKLWLGK